MRAPEGVALPAVICDGFVACDGALVVTLEATAQVPWVIFEQNQTISVHPAGTTALAR